MPCFLVGCAQSEPPINPKKDLSFNHDLGVDDLSGADLAGTDGGDMAPSGGDMARPWADRSFATAQDLFSLWSNGSGLVVAAGTSSTLLKSAAGGAFAADTSSKPAGTANLLALSATGAGPPATPLYVAGANGTLWSYSGNLAASTGTWAVENPNTTNSLYGVWVATDGVAFAVGNQVARKKSGASWATLTGIDASAYNVWGLKNAAGYVVYAVGYDSGTTAGRIWKSTGGNFTSETSGVNEALNGIYGFSETDVYAVGGHGSILHSTGNGVWTKQTAPTAITTNMIPLEAVGGASADEVYIAGDGDTVLHKYGAASTTWVQDALPNANPARYFLAVWANASEVYIAGSMGAIFKK